MLDRPLVLLNSIGRSGGEMVAASLARLPGLALMPGQTGIGDDGRLYRRAPWADLPPETAFERLATHQTTSGGQLWTGFGKYMRPDVRRRYDPARHRALFLADWPERADIPTVLARFVWAFHGAMDTVPSDIRAVGLFGQNFALSHWDDIVGRPSDAKPDVRLISVDCRAPLWLATISENMTWDCRAALAFWIVNNLVLQAFAKAHPAFLPLDLEAHFADPARDHQRVAAFLGIDDDAAVVVTRENLGFLDLDPSRLAPLRASAATLERVYHGLAVATLAERFAEWAPGFIALPEVAALLARYRAYWNSTGHTNFDWIGPIEEEIIARATAFVGAADQPGLAVDFYHRLVTFNSTDHAEPRSHLPHGLGVLETEIPLPPTPYHLKAVITYLHGVATMAIRQAHSWRSVRQGDLYRRLTAPEMRTRVAALGLAPRMAALEADIDRADAAARSRLMSVETALGEEPSR